MLYEVITAMAEGDLNGDGVNDLLIGSSDKQATIAYIQKDGKFTPADFDGLTTEKSITESDLAIVDIDNDGDNDVIAIAGGYVNQQESEYQHLLYINDKGKFTQKELPIRITSYNVCYTKLLRVFTPILKLCLA